MNNWATYCIKVLPAMSYPYFVYINAFSEKEATHKAMDTIEGSGSFFITACTFDSRYSAHWKAVRAHEYGKAA